MQILGKLRDDTALAMKRADSVDVVDADSNVVPALGNTYAVAGTVVVVLAALLRQFCPD
jgi:hypothetical protein